MIWRRNEGLCYTNADNRHVHLAYQPLANSTFLSEQTSHSQSADRTFLSEQISTSRQPNEHAEYQISIYIHIYYEYEC
jgi:hypothetical protein